MNRATLIAILLATALVLGTAGCGGSDGGGGTSDSGDPSSSSPQEPASSSRQSPSSPQESSPDSQKSPSSPAQTPSGSQDFATQADAICSQGGKQTEAEFAAFRKKNGTKNLAELANLPKETKALELEAIETIGIPALRKQIDELQALEAPSEEAPQAEAYVKALEDEQKEVEQEPLLLFKSAKKVFAKSDKLAQQLGFKVCGGH